MKQYLTLIFAVIVVLVLNFVQDKYITKTKNELDVMLENIHHLINSDDFESAYKQAMYINGRWNDISKGWDVFSDHDDVEEVSSHIVSLLSYIKENERADTLNEYNVLKQRIKHVLENEKVSLATVF